MDRDRAADKRFENSVCNNNSGKSLEIQRAGKVRTKTHLPVSLASANDPRSLGTTEPPGEVGAWMRRR